jgi:hypothetical protein
MSMVLGQIDSDAQLILCERQRTDVVVDVVDVYRLSRMPKTQASAAGKRFRVRVVFINASPVAIQNKKPHL